jgi:hypothetical protein
MTAATASRRIESERRAAPTRRPLPPSATPRVVAGAWVRRLRRPLVVHAAVATAALGAGPVTARAQGATAPSTAPSAAPAVPALSLPGPAVATPRDTSPPGATPPTRPPAHPGFAVAYLTAGGLGLPMGALDARLRAAGLPGTAGGAATMGSGAHVVVGRRLVVGAGGQVLLGRTRERAGWRTRVGGGYALGEVGLAAVATPRRLVALTGGVGAARVTTHVRPVLGGRFDSVVVAPRRGVELTSHTLLIHTGLVADHAVRWRRDATLRVGLRAGWMGGVGRSRWRADDATLAGGPEVAPRGAYARLTLGTPLGRRRDALLPALAPALPWVAR